jgi:hypothetical protein
LATLAFPGQTSGIAAKIISCTKPGRTYGDSFAKAKATINHYGFISTYFDRSTISLPGAGSERKDFPSLSNSIQELIAGGHT